MLSGRRVNLAWSLEGPHSLSTKSTRDPEVVKGIKASMSRSDVGGEGIERDKQGRVALEKAMCEIQVLGCNV
jgi:hypothetical protein